MKKEYKIAIAGFLILIGIIAIFQLTGIYDPDNMLVGNNLNATGYGKGGFYREKYKSLEKLLKKVVKNDKLDDKNMDLLYQEETKNLNKIFMLYESEVSEYDIIEYKIYEYEFIKNKDGTYSYSGGRISVFASNYHEKEYDWKETVRSDLSCSTQKGYKKLVNPRKSYGVLPAWGVSDTEQVKDMTVDGQKVDQVIEFTKDEETYYLWIIDDLQTENNAVDIAIEKSRLK